MVAVADVVVTDVLLLLLPFLLLLLGSWPQEYLDTVGGAVLARVQEVLSQTLDQVRCPYHTALHCTASCLTTPHCAWKPSAPKCLDAAIAVVPPGNSSTSSASHTFDTRVDTHTCTRRRPTLPTS